MKTNKIFIVAVASFLLTSCGSSNEIKVSISTAKTDEIRLIKPDDVTISETYYSLENKMLNNTQVLPNEGDINLLIVPVIIPAYETIDLNGDGIDEKEKVRSDIETAFFGDTNLTDQSVASFYKTSSFEKVNIKGTVTDWFSIAEDSDLNITHGAQIETDVTLHIADAIIEWARNVQGLDLTEYDNDKDGYIDGLWMIYSAHNYYLGGPQTDTGNFFAYTSWGNTDISISAPDVENPIYNLFGWASYDFMYENAEAKTIDASTYIHEMGHFFGLNDYYTENFSYNPVGKSDLMDANNIDLNSYSKMLIGWSKPYIVTGNAEISLKSLQNLNNFIVIPADDTEIIDGKFDPFSEYLLVEYYTNEGLNNYGSLNSVAGAPLAPQESGIKIYHIDNRKFIALTEDPYKISCIEYNGQEINEFNRIVLPITNNRNPDIYNYLYNLDANYNLFDEIRLIEAENVDTFSNGGYQKNKTLFKNGDSFSMEEFGPTFFVNNKLNNGKEFSYIINIGGNK